MATSQERPTIIYVHGSGNQLVKPELKLKWDKVLFGLDMGERTRMVYYVDRSRHTSPESEEREIDALGSAQQGLALGSMANGKLAGKAHTARLTPAQIRTQVLQQIARINAANAGKPLVSSSEANVQAMVELYLALDGRNSKGAKGPKAKGIVDVLTMGFAKLIFPDAVDFLLDAAWRGKACQTFADEMLAAGAGQKIVISHSLGSMVALESLNQLGAKRQEVDLWVTLGSPMGMATFRKKMAAWTKSEKLVFPAAVKQWFNMADNYDVAAFQAPDLTEYIDFKDHLPSSFKNFNNPEVFNRCLPDRHRVVGYLEDAKVKQEVGAVAGGAWFKSPLHNKTMSSDLHREFAANTGMRMPVLLELSSDDADPLVNLDTARDALVRAIEVAVKATRSKLEDAEIDPLRHYVAAKLTEEEARLVIGLQAGDASDTRVPALKRIWRNASKKALIAQSINTLQVQPAHLGYEAHGKGITWAVIDTGITIKHPHFVRHANFQPKQLGWDCTKRGSAVPLNSDFVDKDGHGTHVAGIIAGEYTGLQKNGAAVNVKGMAPMAKIVAYKALDDTGSGNDQWTIKAIEHIEALNASAGRLVVHGVNLSLGGDYDIDAYGCGHTPVCKALRRLWRQGVLVVLAAGNEGFASLATYDGEQRNTNFDMSIGDPANLEEAIAVGSVHKTNPVTYGVSYFSSRGPTADGRFKPDCIAPGERILSAASNGMGNSIAELYVEMSGTSMAAPHVSGLLAAFLSVRREYVGEPDKVKKILLENCTDLNRDRYFQGAGLPNLTKMLLNN